MKKHTNEAKFLRISYEMLQINDLTKSDLLALAYNHGNWDGGYYASSEHAAKVLNLNIKTFRKSVTKLKKLGLWTYRGEAIGPRRYSPAGEIKALDGALKAPMGEIKAPAGEIKAPIGEYKNPVLPLKNEVLLDSLLDNKLEKDKKERLDNAAVAANTSTSSSYFNNSEDIKINQARTKLVSETFYDVGDSGDVNKIEDNEDRCMQPNCKLGVRAGPPTREEMIDANFDALMKGNLPPYSDDQVRGGAPKPLSDEFEELFGRESRTDYSDL